MDPDEIQDKTLGSVQTEIKACDQMIKLFEARRDLLKRELSSSVNELSDTIVGAAVKRDSSCRKILRRAQ